jgi:hypothetical protein
MKVAKRLATVSFFLFVTLASCVVAGRHTADSKLEERFFSDEVQFETLLSEVSADDRLESIKADEVRYSGRSLSPQNESEELERLGFSRARWVRCSKILRRLGIALVTKADGIIEFRVDGGSLWNGDSYKGYWYSRVPPFGNRKSSLDGYRLSEADRIKFGGYQVYKPLKGNWYLYLFIDGGR